MKAAPLKRVLFIAAIPLTWVAFFVALEGGLRLFGFGRNYDLFEEMYPGLVVDNPEYTRRFYSLWEEGERSQRSNLFPKEKPPANLRVFVVGGSTAQGFPYQRNHSFTGIAQAALRAAGVNADILNLGNSAMSSYYVRDVLSEIRRYDPDLVVVYAGHNEYYGTPSSFTGGTHATRLALLWLERLRTVQLIEAVARAIVGGAEEAAPTLMERRFAAAMFPEDEERDRRVADLFIENLDAGLRPLVDDGVAAIVFEPISNLVSMPPFRSAAIPPSETAELADAEGADAGAGEPPGDVVALYQQRLSELEAGKWDRAAWERVKDLDPVPFRARSVLVDRLEAYATADPRIRWIPTADEFERRGGHLAFTDSLFIDHLHFNFEGQVLLASLLVEAIVERIFGSDAELLSRVQTYLADHDRIRQDIHLTAFWEVEAHSRIVSLMGREPFASMPLKKAPPPLPTRVAENSLFRAGDFKAMLEGASAEDLFYLALDHYRVVGDRDEYIRNLNASVHLFPGHYEAHLAYGMALLEDDPAAYLEPAGNYFRRAYYLSGRSDEVIEIVREALLQYGLGHVWDAFRARYFE